MFLKSMLLISSLFICLWKENIVETASAEFFFLLPHPWAGNASISSAVLPYRRARTAAISSSGPPINSPAVTVPVKTTERKICLLNIFCPI